jgi:hypothetical protein
MDISTSLLREMIDELVLMELGQIEGDPLVPSTEPVSTRRPVQRGRGTNRKNPNQVETDDINRYIQGLMRRRGGTATLTRGHMEKLDWLTRWLTWIPGGNAYRKGLAKYLRSKRDPEKQDKLRPWRRYKYDGNNPRPSFGE